ncbi:MAG: DUF447 domain-containing protein [Gemmataceae bacterium]
MSLPDDQRILEGIVTTVSAAGAVNVAPMGPIVNDDFSTLIFRPFQSAQTYRNLRGHGQGVFHVVDDVEQLARAAVGEEVTPPLRAAAQVRGFVLEDCCRYFEFEVTSLDDREERTRIEARVVHAGRVREFFGFNRAKHAVVEAAILATRLHLIPAAEIDVDFARLAVIVDKTGALPERRAFGFLADFVKRKREET